MKRISQLVAIIGFSLAPTQLIAQSGVAVAGFETSGSAGLSRGDYSALGMALTALLTSELRARSSRLATLDPMVADRSGRLDDRQLRSSAAESGAALFVVGHAMDQYGDVSLELRLLGPDLSPLASLGSGAPKVLRSDLSKGISVLADHLTSRPEAGGSPRAARIIPTAALIEFGRGLVLLKSGDDTGASAAFERAVNISPAVRSLVSELQDGNG